MSPADPIADFNKALKGKSFATILADPPWRFQNRTGKMAPEHHRLSRYGTMTIDEIKALPVPSVAAACRPIGSVSPHCTGMAGSCSPAG